MLKGIFVPVVLKAIIILLAGVVAGFINSVSASGSLVTLAAFIFAGLTSAQANATNRLSLLFQNFFSAYGFKGTGLKTEKYMWQLAAATVPGALIGAYFSLKIPDHLFNRILSVVMIVFLIITLVNPLKSAVGNHERMDTRHKVLGVVVYFLIGIYGGFIQAGAGFFLMAGCLLIHRFDIIKTNYYKAVIMLTYTLPAFALFLWNGQIVWFYGILMSIGASVGGYIGTRWSLNADDARIRWMIVAIILVLSVYLWVFK